jgi:pyroglutamyl-peptidase
MILITGFGPYREELNASGALVDSLKNDLPEALAHLKDQLVFEVIACDDTSRETEHQSLEAQLKALLEQYEPELCIHTGQAPPYNKIVVEKIATNSFMREMIDPGRPVGYWANLPGTEGLQTALEAQHIPAGYSFYAGQHLCNHILFSSLYLAEKNALAHKSGFIHIPVLPEQVTKQHRDAPCMPVDMSRKALTIIMNHVVAAHRHDLSR